MSTGSWQCPFGGRRSCGHSIKEAKVLVGHFVNCHNLSLGGGEWWIRHLLCPDLSRRLERIFRGAKRWVCGRCMMHHPFTLRCCRTSVGSCCYFSGGPSGRGVSDIRGLFPGLVERVGSPRLRGGDVATPSGNVSNIGGSDRGPLVPPTLEVEPQAGTLSPRGEGALPSGPPGPPGSDLPEIRCPCSLETLHAVYERCQPTFRNIPRSVRVAWAELLRRCIS
jgi:hypothetical protein